MFATCPVRTHFFNMVPLAWALGIAGHEVCVASGSEITGTITGAGLTAVAVGPEETLAQRTLRALRDDTFEVSERPLIDLAENRAEKLGWEFLSRLYDRLLLPEFQLLNDSMFDDLVEFARWWEPDLVVWDAWTYAGPVAATAVGAAHLRALCTFDVYGRMRKHFLRELTRQRPQARRDSLAEWLGERARTHGCEFTEDMVNGQLTLDQMPDSFQLDIGLPRLSMRYVPYNGPSVLPDWLRTAPSAPRVLITFGVSARTLPEMQTVSVGRMREMVKSLGDLDIELVVTLPADAREELGDVPDNTRVVEFVPLHAVLPSCSAVVHHGGAGTFSSSLLYGIPQLLISMTPDVTLKDAHLRKSGAGLSLAPGWATGANVRDALLRLLTEPSFRTGADRLRQEVSTQPSPYDVVPELERLAARHRGRPTARAACRDGAPGRTVTEPRQGAPR